ncbi:hypothetical protein MNBD_ALPHA06-859, partial [hydrothermal vent metagenome]
MVFQPEPTPFDDLHRLISNVPDADLQARDRAAARQAEIAVPSGELGRLADIALWVASWQGQT